MSFWVRLFRRKPAPEPEVAPVAGEMPANTKIARYSRRLARLYALKVRTPEQTAEIKWRQRGIMFAGYDVPVTVEEALALSNKLK